MDDQYAVINPDQPITSADTIRHARNDFAAGRPRDEHGLHWASPARVVYLREYDRLANLARLAANQQGVPAP